MYRLVSIVMFFGVLALFQQACNDSSFGGASGKAGNDGGGEGDGDDTGCDDLGLTCGSENIGGDDIGSDDTTPGVDDCTDGEKIKLIYPEKIKGCIDQGNLYHFETESCTGMKPSSFSCDFDSLTGEIDQRKPGSHLIDSIREYQNKGGLMVGCGQAAGTDIIVGQIWVPPPEGSANCKYTAGGTSILSICFDSTGEVELPSGASEEERAQFVLRCMSHD